MDLRISKNGAYVGGGALAKLKIEKILRNLKKIYYYYYYYYYYYHYYY